MDSEILRSLLSVIQFFDLVLFVHIFFYSCVLCSFIDFYFYKLAITSNNLSYSVVCPFFYLNTLLLKYFKNFSHLFIFVTTLHCVAQYRLILFVVPCRFLWFLTVSFWSLICKECLCWSKWRVPDIDNRQPRRHKSAPTLHRLPGTQMPRDNK